MSNIRITVFEKGSDMPGKIFILSGSLYELKDDINKKFNTQLMCLYNEFGGEIDDIIQIRDNDVLYFDTIHAKTRKTLIRSNYAKQNKDWVTLNVGGKYFTTSKNTLQAKEPNSMLARMFAETTGGYLMAPSNVDENGAYLIDRSPIYFEPILNFLRNGQLIFDTNVNPEGILEEAKFFGIDSVVSLLDQVISTNKVLRDDLPLSRRDVIDALIISHTSELRFQGVNLAGSDLSKLDLRCINFKFANLRGCNLTGCNLNYCYMERADLSHAILDGAQLFGVRCLCANMEGAQLRKCNFEDPAGSRANMEGVNLKGANLEGSSMGGVNLRVATLKNANLKNCILRAAVFAGADLENCDLSGSDLHEANLRGANLKDAAFELMQTPLHMSQTIR